MGAEDAQNGRHWNRRVSFVQHLAGAMSSIANVWKRQLRSKSCLSWPRGLYVNRKVLGAMLQTLTQITLPAEWCMMQPLRGVE